jgi:putative transposon-encoded protein
MARGFFPRAEVAMRYAAPWAHPAHVLARTAALWILSACAGAAPTPPPAPVPAPTPTPAAPADVAETHPGASIVFDGTVTGVGKAAMDMVPASSNTFVVRVGSALRTPSELTLPAEITVYTSGRVPVVGDRATFFADPWLIGSGLAVREIAREAAADAARLRPLLDSGAARARDTVATLRLRTAEVIAMGSVIAAGDSVALPRPRVESEHDPQWRVARIRVDTTYRGGGGSVVEFLYPSSIDVLWYDVPKPRVGDRAIWLLRRDSTVDRLVLLDPRDRLDVSQAGRVRALLNR